MAYEVKDLHDYFIATVKGYNELTRELDVFIPKLMPAVPNGQESISILTNLSNQSFDNLKYNQKINTKSTIKVKAENVNEPLPDIGSHVLIYFIDGNMHMGCWKKFNQNGDYNIIENEKYENYYSLTIGNKKISVSKDDDIVIELPESFESVIVNDDKTKTIIIREKSNIETRL